jgi:hypothetical protein
MIKPTPGRVVWFTPSRGIDTADFAHHDPLTPLAAIVSHVWGDRMVNLAVFDSNGKSHSRTSVMLLQDDDAKPEGGYFCSWMPYQVGQAAKTAEAEAKVSPGA